MKNFFSFLLVAAATAALGENNASYLFDGVTTSLVSDVVVGNSGTNNTLTVRNNAKVAGLEALLGNGVGSAWNKAGVSGESSVWSNRGLLAIGQRGFANTLNVNSGGVVVAREGSIGRFPTASNNVVIVQGLGARWSNQINLAIGETGSGNELRIADGGRVWSRDADVGRSEGAGGNRVVVSSPGSVWEAAARLGVGQRSAGNSLTASNGSLISCTLGMVGARYTANSNVVQLSGDGTTWHVASNLTIGVEGSFNRVMVSAGAELNSGPACVGDLPGSISNSVIVTGTNSRWTVRGPLIVGRDGAGSTLSLADGAELAATCMAIGTNGIMYVAGAIDLSGMGPISNAGRIVTTSPLAFGGDLTLAPGSQLLGPTNGTWTFAGDFINACTNPGLDLLHNSFIFSPNAGHALSPGCQDRSNQLSGFNKNKALGSLLARGTVDVVNTVYTWTLAGNGRLDIGAGDRLYFVSANQWSGTANVAAGGVFQEIPLSFESPQLQDDNSVRLSWPSGPGLHFGIEWAGDMMGAAFVAATNFTGSGTNDAWIDPTLSTQRNYRFQAWP